MPATKADIISQLQKEILSLQGFRSTLNNIEVDTGLGVINQSFPNQVFPLGAVHELFCYDTETHAASAGFVSGIIASLMKGGGACLWISASRKIFPPALKMYGIDPEKIIFIDIKKESDVLWAIEEALKCDGLPAVVGELRDLSFTASRRLQLAVEQSRVTAFLLRLNPGNLTTAAVTRWKVSPMPSVLEDGLPGVGFSRWMVELLRVRNGHSGQWTVEWSDNRFNIIPQLAAIVLEQKRKTG